MLCVDGSWFLLSPKGRAFDNARVTIADDSKSMKLRPINDGFADVEPRAPMTSVANSTREENVADGGQLRASKRETIRHFVQIRQHRRSKSLEGQASESLTAPSVDRRYNRHYAREDWERPAARSRRRSDDDASATQRPDGCAIRLPDEHENGPIQRSPTAQSVRQ